MNALLNTLLPIHVAAGGLALVLGAVALLARKGGTVHRLSTRFSHSPTRPLDFDVPIALAHRQARLVVRGGPIQHAAIVEGELGPVPWTHDRPVFQRPLG